jgi:hypothetical protein
MKNLSNFNKNMNLFYDDFKIYLYLKTRIIIFMLNYFQFIFNNKVY